jgi:tetratricopeptide (TPR) repeat protein
MPGNDYGLLYLVMLLIIRLDIPLLKDGKYREALGKWETALTLTPDQAVLHEQKAQALLELGEAWNALKAATRVSSYFPSFYFLHCISITKYAMKPIHV